MSPEVPVWRSAFPKSAGMAFRLSLSTAGVLVRPNPTLVPQTRTRGGCWFEIFFTDAHPVTRNRQCQSAERNVTGQQSSGNPSESPTDLFSSIRGKRTSFPIHHHGRRQRRRCCCQKRQRSASAVIARPRSIGHGKPERPSGQSGFRAAVVTTDLDTRSHTHHTVRAGVPQASRAPVCAPLNQRDKPRSPCRAGRTGTAAVS